MVAVNFAFTCEGTSDAPLLAVLRRLLIDSGATQVVGQALPVTGTVQAKVERVIRQFSDCNLLFVHRDSDDRESEPRYVEIAAGVGSAGWTAPFVCVVPVQMTEGWLIADEREIRQVAGRPSGRVALGLPAVGAIERAADPKSLLHEAYLRSTETTGRRRAVAKKQFGTRRATLIERLDIHGPVRQLESFQRLVADIEGAVTALAQLEAATDDGSTAI